jgi:hypothetical protein
MVRRGYERRGGITLKELDLEAVEGLLLFAALVGSLLINTSSRLGWMEWYCAMRHDEQNGSE